MKIKKLFISDNNVCFTDKESCLAYENELKNNPDDPGVYFYNKDGYRIYNKVEDAFYLRITNSVIAKALTKSSEPALHGCHKCYEYLPTEVGYYNMEYITADGIWQWERIDGRMVQLLCEGYIIYRDGEIHPDLLLF